MACLRSVDRFVRRNSLPVNVVINVILMLLCLVSYAALFALYFSQGININPFVYIHATAYTLPPTVVIPLIGVTLNSATSALLTRSVEHSLWETILRDKSVTRTGEILAPRDASQQAQWSTSSFARLLYSFNGKSWTLQLGGLFVLGTAIVNPVLLYGVRPDESLELKNSNIVPSQPAFAGFTSEISELSVLPDASMVLASLASMNNFSAPLANVCSPDNCLLNAEVPALMAECVASYRTWNSGDEVRCSAFGNETCVTWTPHTVLNFTTGPSSACSERIDEDFFTSSEPLCPPGDFAVIFGEWLSSKTPQEEDDRGSDTYTKHTVDCRVSYGTVDIRQQYFGPKLNRTSFVKSNTPIGDQDSLASVWQYGFLGYGGRNYSPYTFAYTQLTLNAMTPLSRYLVPLESNSSDSNDTAQVARTIEANFDMTTLFAFARAPRAATVKIVETLSRDIWAYDVKVLLVLVFPFLATVSVLSTHRKVQSGDVVLGYDPVLIARRADEVLAFSSAGGGRCGEGSSGGSLGLEKVGRAQSVV